MVPDAVRRVDALLGAAQLRRDLLVEYLHRIQDALGCLQADDLVALAARMRLAPVEVFEVASFYHHFEVSARAMPPALTVRVCDSLSCAMAGADRLIEALSVSVPAGLTFSSDGGLSAGHQSRFIADL